MTINSILADAAESLKLYEAALSTLPPDVPTEKTLESAIQLWAQHAHEELGSEAQGAFSSQLWSRLSWWRVLWDAGDIPNVVKLMVSGGGGLGILGKAER